MPVLRAERLTKSYNNRVVVRDLSLEVETGEGTHTETGTGPGTRHVEIELFLVGQMHQLAARCHAFECVGTLGGAAGQNGDRSAIVRDDHHPPAERRAEERLLGRSELNDPGGRPLGAATRKGGRHVTGRAGRSARRAARARGVRRGQAAGDETDHDCEPPHRESWYGSSTVEIPHGCSGGARWRVPRSRKVRPKSG